ncbi:hypothetical protein GAO09_28490 [Rhizobiales bacterium RZME27]|jgi:hypothetical protein|uniref:Uncharacterized protein n=1 Tax=Endobacterium cereale TaxID=2663029 RepID=A0A6A8AFT6_9HYPH|nr:hypothetical protein [Endobacterium cereale]MEB2845858.1 hypothetical protein [Endobacterium cereale]MQY49972.1 hypothetical protein [Endobacterium cereale]
MLRLTFACIFLVVGLPASAASLPADVQTYVTEREACDHFRGEEPYDAERAKEISAALDRYCRGTDARLNGLKKKYRNAPAAIREVLNGFEYPIE